jgi:8-oxo-dGTP diphosphatase
MGRSDQGVHASRERYTAIPRVLVFILSDANEVLLLKGAPTKRIWANRYNGVGGHVEAGEDVYTAAWREVREETGLEVHDLRLRGVVNIDVNSPGDNTGVSPGNTGDMPGNPGVAPGILLFVFSARSDQRRTIPSPEGTLEWVPLDRLAEYNLVEDLPLLLARIAGPAGGGHPHETPFFARYFYDEADRLRIEFAKN